MYCQNLGEYLTHGYHPNTTPKDMFWIHPYYHWRSMCLHLLILFWLDHSFISLLIGLPGFDFSSFQALFHAAATVIFRIWCHSPAANAQQIHRGWNANILVWQRIKHLRMAQKALHHLALSSVPFPTQTYILGTSDCLQLPHTHAASHFQCYFWGRMCRNKIWKFFQNYTNSIMAYAGAM